MPAPNIFPNQLALGNATTSGDRVTFGFNPSWLRLRNREAVDIYINLKGGTTAAEELATTGTTMYRMRACSDDVIFGVVGANGLNAKTTATGATDKILDILALGG